MKTPLSPRISFDDVGDGDLALLWLAGWCGPRTLSRSSLADLAEHNRVLAFDWRGHGASEPCDVDFGYDELIEDASRVLEVSGVDRFIPIAVSHAGWAAIDLRRRFGARRVPGIVLVDWMPLGAPPGFADALTGLQHPTQWEAVRAALFERWTAGTSLPALTHYIEEMGRSDRAMWSRAGREIAGRFEREPIPLEVIAQDPCPTLHLYGQPSDPAFLRAQQDYAANHPWFSVERLPAKSHFPMLEVPRELAARIDLFRRKVAR
jgi:pimeloyl-ACP methyl ester carboxylesterase